MINEDARQRTVIVIGHTNPDTDSICSAIAYAELKNRISHRANALKQLQRKLEERMSQEQ